MSEREREYLECDCRDTYDDTIIFSCCCESESEIRKYNKKCEKEGGWFDCSSVSYCYEYIEDDEEDLEELWLDYKIDDEELFSDIDDEDDFLL